MNTFTIPQENRQSVNLPSEYWKPCPKCHAAAGERCTSGHRVYWHGHKARRKILAPFKSPVLVSWWRKQKPFEGQFAAPRPAGYVVPSNSAIMAGAA